MRSVLPERRHVNGHALIEGAMEDAYSHLMGHIGQDIGIRLSSATEHVLGWAPYARRGHVPCTIEQTRACPKCRRVQSRHFSRNGSRPRRLLTRWGEVPLRWPRLVCQCGGSITLDLDDWLPPYQRIGSDVDAQIQRWGAISLSLRDMQREVAHSYIGVLGLRTLLKRLHQLQSLTPGPDERATPPIVQMDAIWFTQLCATGQWRTDSRGRHRPVKSRRKRCLLIALGVWPDSDDQQVLAWQLADSEDAQAWLTFLSLLEQQGIRGENGLELIIHDGGSGLCAAWKPFISTPPPTLPVPQAPQHLERHSCGRRTAHCRTSTPAPHHLPRLRRHLPGHAMKHRSASRLACRAETPCYAVRCRRHPATRLPGHCCLLHCPGTLPNLAPQTPAHHQSPRTLQPVPAPTHPQR